MLGPSMSYPKQTPKSLLASLPSSLLASLLICALVPACDKAQDKQDKQEDKVEEQSDLEKQAAENIAAKQAKRDAEAKALADTASAVTALAVLPEAMPKDLESACKGAAEAYDKFMQTHYEGDSLEKWNGAKDAQMDILHKGCVAEGSVESAACQINALGNAPAELKKELTNLMDACKAKFGAAAAAAPQ